MANSKIFTRTIWTLGLVSLLTDISSEMLYPVMPIYLKSIGFTALWIGVLEGIAEAVVGLSKGYFGKHSDDKGKRLPFIQLGYFLSSISKPLMAAFIYPFWIFLVRSTDRLGKGIRTGARDALLSEASLQEHRGKVFGFHRAMDTVGAALGPFAALIYLHFYPGNYKPLFLLAFFPALLGVFLTLIIKEKPKETETKKESNKNFFAYFSYWKTATVEYKKLILGLLLFSIFNSSDVFLLLLAKNAGIDDTHIIGVYIFYNLVYALFAFPMGSLADKIGMKKSFIIGLILFCSVYLGMAFLQNIQMLYVLFFLYGVYAASTEGISKAWISKICLPKETATAIGFYASTSSISTIVASSLAGLLWVSFTPNITFLVSALGAFCVIIYFKIAIKSYS